MNYFLPFLAGILGGWALLEVPLSDSFLASIVPVTDFVGVVSMVVFSAALIYKGFKTFFGKS